MKSITVKIDAVLCKLKFYSSVPKCANEYVKIDRMNIMEIILMVNILNCYYMNYSTVISVHCLKLVYRMFSMCSRISCHKYDYLK